MRAPLIGLFVAAMTIFGTASASTGYLMDTRGEVVRNGYGECWHTGFWKPADAIVGCDGKVAMAPEPMAEPEPAPMPPPKPRIETVVLDADTYFAFDKATLRPEAVSTLDALVERVKGTGDVESIHIVGHTDRIGTEAYNQGLSERRAETVRQYLIDRKALAAEQITVKGMGETMPVKACTGVRGRELIQCLQPNRRVEVKIKCTRCTK